MNVLFVGLGSIGTRHLKNLTAICKSQGINLNVHALRSSTRALPAETSALVDKEFEAGESLDNYDLAFITNPTNLHFDALQALKGKVSSFFIEKPIFESTSRKLSDCLLPNQKAYIAAPMRFCKTYLELKKLISTLHPYSARIICSSYLPDWRKGVDYRTVYSAKREMGGGVTIDLIHEWDYLVDLFGAPLECFNFKGTYSHLEITSDDLSVYIARYKNLLAEIHLDYFGREYRRNIEIFCENGTVVADFGAGTLKTENGTIIDCTEDVNQRYLREMQYFLDYCKIGGESINSPQKALDVLKLTLNQ